MSETQMAAVLRILGRAALDLAEVMDGGQPASVVTDAGGNPPDAADAAEPANLPAYARKRGRYLLAYVKAGGELTRAQVTAAAKAAGVGNPGSATSRGYVGKTPQ